MERATDILSTTDRLLLLAVRKPKARGEKAAQLLAREDFDWNDLTRDSGQNRIDSFVADLLAMPKVLPQVTPGRGADWRARAMLGVFRMEMARKHVKELGDSMHCAGIDLLAYKGVDFQIRCYSKEIPRGFGDIDILVSPKNVARAAECMEAMGYCRTDRKKSAAYYRRFHLHDVYSHARHSWPVELHWALDSPHNAGVDPTPLILEAAASTPELGDGVLRPSSVDALALMCTHLAKHLAQVAWLPQTNARLKAVIMESGLIWLLDIVRWLQRHASGVSADQILERMRQLGVERSYIVGMRLAVDLEPDELPNWTARVAERMPRRVPLFVRLIYPDLAAGRAIDSVGQDRRRMLCTMWPRGGFRPIRVLQLFLPAGRIPIKSRVPRRTRALAASRRAGLLIFNAWVLLWARARERRGSRWQAPDRTRNVDRV